MNAKNKILSERTRPLFSKTSNWNISKKREIQKNMSPVVTNAVTSGAKDISTFFPSNFSQNPSMPFEVSRKFVEKTGNNSKPARNAIKTNGIECWQINLHRCKAASYNICEVIHTPWNNSCSRTLEVWQ